MTRFALPLAFVLLAGCARSEPAEYTQFDNNASLTVNAPLVDTDDDELAIGAWRMSLQDGQSVLEFGPAAVVGTGGALPMLRATLPANDPFRGVLIAAASPIVVRIGDSVPLALPPSPLIGTYSAQCASGDVRPPEAAANGVAPAGDPGGNAVEVNVAGNAQ